MYSSAGTRIFCWNSYFPMEIDGTLKSMVA